MHARVVRFFDRYVGTTGTLLGLLIGALVLYSQRFSEWDELVLPVTGSMLSSFVFDVLLQPYLKAIMDVLDDCLNLNFWEILFLDRPGYFRRRRIERRNARELLAWEGR